MMTDTKQTNDTNQTLGGEDNKKKLIFGGGAVVAVLLLLSLTSSADTGNLDQTFPVDASVAEQCEFLGNYESSMMQAAVDGFSASDIKELMREDMIDSDQFDRSPAKMFYELKESRIRKIDKLVKSLESEDFKEMSTEEVEAKIAKQGKRREQRCLDRFAES
ncbi:hypothetical protein EXU30_08970 [Shewanella maritima]|uniref:Uncharacterized protein n=1 Tax=Shewanella maritima TaxID=2520507 RepID=A0A411PH22_9GAMM|nr:hypothetical protein [Shewanella maritima]QBF82808.1 hypothetical protein EXU30_08970 [Shewanella maritima]